MGIKDRLQNQGSLLTAFDGETPPQAIFPDPLDSSNSDLSAYKGLRPPQNPLATKQSKLLWPYSIDGDDAAQVRADYQLYAGSLGGNLPQPSQLDMGAMTPPRYLDNLPSR